MSELDKLERYLIAQGIKYIRIEKEEKRDADGHLIQRDWHQIRVFNEDGKESWDAVCHEWSYGYEEGLLEIMGDIVREDSGDSVEGYLTAEDVVERIVEFGGQKDRGYVRRPIRELIVVLREQAEWADANIWEVPITLPDNLRQAADELEGKYEL